MADEWYQTQGAAHVVGLGVAAVGFIVTGLSPGPDDPIVLFLVIGVLCGVAALWFHLRWPHRVGVQQAGVTFESRTETQFVPWNELLSVRYRYYNHPGHLQWQLTGGRQVRTRTVRYSDMMYGEIKRLRPEIEIRPEKPAFWTTRRPGIQG